MNILGGYAIYYVVMFVIAMLYYAGTLDQAADAIRDSFRKESDLDDPEEAKKKKKEEKEKRRKAYWAKIGPWIEEVNNAENSGYPFLDNAVIWKCDFPKENEGDYSHVEFELDNGKHIKGVFQFNGSDVTEFIQNSKREQVEELSYDILKRDVEDVVDNDMYAYVNASISDALPCEGTAEILFDCAKGLDIPYEEFVEKYDTPKYNQAWDEVISAVMEKCGITATRAGIGKYNLEAQDLSFSASESEF